MKKGDVMEFKEDTLLPGAKVLILRVSKRTGGLTVELLEARGAFQKGTEMHVKQYEVQSVTVTRC